MTHSDILEFAALLALYLIVILLSLAGLLCLA